MSYLIAVLALTFGVASADTKEIIKGEVALQMYSDLLTQQAQDPDSFLMWTNVFFGDDQRPELGKLWLTTLMRKDSNTTCYEYDFRESRVKDYLCEVINP